MTEDRQAKIDVIRGYPGVLRALVAGLGEDELRAHPLQGEWSVAQNVHHLVDSHMNSVVRLKLMLTEDKPNLLPYDQEAWAELPDVHQTPIEASLLILDGLHARWANLFESVTDWTRQGYHPEIGDITVDDLLDTYAQHCHAHIDQITRTKAALPQ